MDKETLTPEQFLLLQGIMDNHCAMIYDRYLQERREQDEKFMKELGSFKYEAFNRVAG